MDVMEARRRLLMRKKSRLPSEYQEVEYIQTPSMSYDNYKAFICTNISNSDIGYIICKIEVSQVSTYGPMIMASYTANSNTPTNPFVCVNGNTSGNITINPQHSNPWMGVDTFLITYPVNSQNYLRIGGWSDKAWTGQYKYYNVDVFDRNNQIIAKFIPCYRKSDNAVGLYEIVSNIFHQSNGALGFIAGPNV